MALWLALPLPAARAAALDDDLPTAAQLAGSILVGGRSLDYLRGLTDTIGPRLTGSGNYQRAAQWAAAEFRAAGLKDVRLESFMIPNGWERVSAEGRILGATERPLHIISVPWSPSTPKGGVRGEILIVTDLAPDKLEAQRDRLRGRIVLLDGATLFQSSSPAKLSKVFDQIRGAYPLFEKAGVVGLLWAGSRPNNVHKPSSVKFSGARLGQLPAADIGLEDFKLIERLMDAGPGSATAQPPVRVEFRLDNRTSGPVMVNNVIAELRGREKPDEWVLVGAHLDSWDLATGAQDNGTGTAMVLEAARAIVQSGKAPRRSLRFALWGGEEQGLLGSRSYVKAHRGELDKVVAVLNTDLGAGAPKGWMVGGREDVTAALKPIAQRLLKGLGGGDLSQTVTCDTDHASFFVLGVPAFTLWTDSEHYFEIHHLGSDTFDKVSPGNLAAGSAVVAVTAWAVAEREARLGAQLDEAAVDALLDKGDQKQCKKRLLEPLPQ
jgi:hypothetical protein